MENMPFIWGVLEVEIGEDVKLSFVHEYRPFCRLLPKMKTFYRRATALASKWIYRRSYKKSYN